MFVHDDSCSGAAGELCRCDVVSRFIFSRTVNCFTITELNKTEPGKHTAFINPKTRNSLAVSVFVHTQNFPDKSAKVMHPAPL